MLRSAKLKKVFLILSLICLHVSAVVKLTFYYRYGTRFSASAFYIIFETNSEESIGFLKYYFDTFMLVFCLLFSFLLIYFIRRILKKAISNKSLRLFKNQAIAILFLIGIILGSAFVLVTKFKDYDLLVNSIASYKEYKALKDLVRANLAEPLSDFVTTSDTVNSVENHIVIIGESTCRRHMSLYNYERKTNPKLSSTEGLYVFNDVISPGTMTLSSLDKILTFSDHNNPFKRDNTSIVQLANHAGFQTYWLSNQQPVGLHDTHATQIAHAANKKYFLASNGLEDISYDEIVFDKLGEVLKDKKKSKVIFIHLKGTHAPYGVRYPSEFAHFNEDEIIDPSLKKFQNKILNQYDNAVLYNDYIVSTIIKKVHETKIKSTVTYFSDHGEEVYDTGSRWLLGHDELNPTLPMYEIPFLIWLSKEYDASEIKNQIAESVNRAYKLGDFPHTFSDILQCTHNLFDAEKSIINKNYKTIPRLIAIGNKEIDYNTKKTLQ